MHVVNTYTCMFYLKVCTEGHFFQTPKICHNPMHLLLEFTSSTTNCINGHIFYQVTRMYLFFSFFLKNKNASYSFLISDVCVPRERKTHHVPTFVILDIIISRTLWGKQYVDWVYSNIQKPYIISMPLPASHVCWRKVVGCFFKKIFFFKEIMLLVPETFRIIVI